MSYAGQIRTTNITRRTNTHNRRHTGTQLPQPNPHTFTSVPFITPKLFITPNKAYPALRASFMADVMVDVTRAHSATLTKPTHAHLCPVHHAKQSIPSSACQFHGRPPAVHNSHGRICRQLCPARANKAWLMRHRQLCTASTSNAQLMRHGSFILGGVRGDIPQPDQRAQASSGCEVHAENKHQAAERSKLSAC